MTSHPLHVRIQQVARYARGLVLLHGLCWFVAVVVVATLGLGLADYFLRYRETGVRTLSSLAWVVACGWAFRRFCGPVLSYRLEDVSVAQRVERSFPQFRDRLSSSMQFLADPGGGSQLGSIGLQQAVVAEAEELAKGIDLSDCLNARATRQAVMFAIPVMLLAAALFAADRDSSHLALRRLAMPWSGEAWPRWNRLYFVDAPSRLAAGQDFTVSVQDANRHLPATVYMQYWFEGDSEEQIETYPMARSKHAKSHHRKNITRSFQYRARGGDDDTMEWISLQVVEPASVEQLSIRLQPPAQSGLSAADVSAGEIAALQGSTIEVTGRTSRRVESARLVVEGMEQPLAINAKLAADGRSFQLPAWPIQQLGSGEYWLQLVEPDGVIGGYETRASWRVMADAPPEIAVVSPGADEIVTARAVVSVRAIASDDLAVRRVLLDLGGDQLTLYEGPASPPARESLGQRDEREISFSCELGSLNLQPGDALQISATAIDYAGQQQATVARRLRIVADDEFALVLQERQKQLKHQLAEALRIQTAIHTQTTALQTQLTEVAAASDADIALLRGSELQQRQVRRLLADEDGGAAMLVAKLLAAIESNRVEESLVAARLAEFAVRLRLINLDLLPQIRSALVRSSKAMAAPTFRPAGVVGLLEHAGQGQNAVVESLHEMINRLSEWDDYRRFARDFAMLLRSQQDLRSRADAVPTLGKPLNELSPAERSELIRLSTQQGSLSRQFDRLRASMVQFIEQLDGTSAVQVETLLAAARVADEQAVTEHMLQAKLTLAQNQLGAARREIGQAESGLQAVVDVLAGRAEDGLARTRRLAKVSGELDELTTAQGKLRKQFAELGDITNPAQRRAAAGDLAQQQSDVADQAREVADALRSLGAEDAATSVERGIERARQASDLASSGQTADSVNAAGDAEQRFAEASRQVAGELRQSRERGLRRMSARFREAVRELAKTQRMLQERFAADHERSQQPDAAARWEQLAQQQRALAAATDSTRDEFQPPKVFSIALTWTARCMREAAEGLRSNATAEEVAALQSEALRRLQALLETLEAADLSPPSPGSSEGSPDGQGDRKASRYSEAELRILLGMQSQIHEQTKELEQESRGSRSQEKQNQLRRERLAADQRQLSEVVGDLAASPAAEGTAAAEDGSSLEEDLKRAVEEAAGPDAADFDPRLLEGLDARSDPPAGEDLGQPGEKDPLSIVAERMGHVARRIVEDETLQPAQQLQQEILHELTRLAEEAAQHSQQQTSRTASPPKASQQGDDKPPSPDNTAAGSPRDVDPIEAVWGSLPDRVRQGIRSPLHEEFLPEYKHVIAEYYKRLAAQGRLRSDR